MKTRLLHTIDGQRTFAVVFATGDAAALSLILFASSARCAPDGTSASAAKNSARK